ncbi:MCE family protein [candidate division KSB1 bacterium]|nr:MCE family protein [candidate division KSB1 bacterium]
MRKIGAEVASGVAIFLAFIILIAGFLFLKNTLFETGTYTLLIEFNDITGLEPADMVSVSGLRIGKVDDFELRGLKVFVTISISPDVQLPTDSHAQIKSLGMVGEKFIDIRPGTSSNFLKDGDTLQGKSVSDFSDLTGSAEGLMLQAEELLGNIKIAFKNIFDAQGQADLKETLAHLRSLSATLNNNSGHIAKTLMNIDSLSTNLSEILSARRGEVESSIKNFSEASNMLEGLTSKMDKSMTSVQSLLAKIENEEGSVGKVIAKDDLYNDLRHLTAELDTLVQDLKKRPQKYLNLGFIKFF